MVIGHGHWPYAYQPDIEKQFPRLKKLKNMLKITQYDVIIETVNKISYSEFKSKSTCKL